MVSSSEDMLVEIMAVWAIHIYFAKDREFNTLVLHKRFDCLFFGWLLIELVAWES